MQVTKITSPEQLQSSPLERMTNEQLQNEYNYILAEQMTRKLLDKGLISEAEFGKIMAKNRQSFSPYISKIMR